MSAGKRALAVVVALLGIASARPALAHLMPPGRGTVHVVDDSVYVVLSVPVAALHGFDDDRDGLLEAGELERHQGELRAEIGRRLVVSDGGVPGSTERVDLVLSPEHEAAPDRAAEVVVLDHTRFARAPEDLRLACDLFGGGEGGSLSLTATRHVGAEKQVEVATLTPASAEHRFFPPAAPSTSRRALAGVALVGALLALFVLAPAVRRKGRAPGIAGRCRLR